jgi:DNA-directed RNA polymerase
MPNLVHSLDATTLALVIDKLFKENINNFYSVHDCFAVTCNNISKLLELLSNTYANIYSDTPYLIKFHNDFLNSIKNYYGPNCIDSVNNTITIARNNEPIILSYPDINKVINNSVKIDFEKSSYLIH